MDERTGAYVGCRDSCRMRSHKSGDPAIFLQIQQIFKKWKKCLKKVPKVRYHSATNVVKFKKWNLSRVDRKSKLYIYIHIHVTCVHIHIYVHLHICPVHKQQPTKGGPQQVEEVEGPHPLHPAKVIGFRVNGQRLWGGGRILANT